MDYFLFGFSHWWIWNSSIPDNHRASLHPANQETAKLQLGNRRWSISLDISLRQILRPGIIKSHWQKVRFWEVTGSKTDKEGKFTPYSWNKELIFHSARRLLPFRLLKSSYLQAEETENHFGEILSCFSGLALPIKGIWFVNYFPNIFCPTPLHHLQPVLLQYALGFTLLVDIVGKGRKWQLPHISRKFCVSFFSANCKKIKKNKKEYYVFKKDFGELLAHCCKLREGMQRRKMGKNNVIL